MADPFNLGDLDVFTQALRKAPTAANIAADLALKEGAEKALTEGRKALLKELNLEAAYVYKQLSISKRSSRGNLLTRISAKRRAVLAPRFGAEQKLVPARSPKAKLKGDPYRRIPKGKKAAGSTRWGPKRGGKRVAWGNAFFIWGKNSGALIMVTRKTRDPKSKLQAIYGTSVDEAWRDVRQEVARPAMDLVVKTFSKEFNRLT